jgi:hypothetical protein
MPSTFEKLNLKNHHKRIFVLNAPESFEHELANLHDVTIVRHLQGQDDIQFSLAFVTKQQELDTLGKAIAKRAKGDSVVWFAYPKGTSKRYKSELSRDNGWEVLGKLGFEGVRSVAIDDDWSGARFRRTEFIKTMNRARQYAMSPQGQARPAKK